MTNENRERRIRGLREYLAERLFGDVIQARVQNAVKVVDDKWWNEVSSAGAGSDLTWTARQSDLDGALEAWRTNPLARQVVRLTRGFVLQDGITFRARSARLQAFVDAFWNHRQNRMPRRVRQWCDALTLFGELFPVLFLNRADGMTYVRSIPARRIDRIETAEDDHERARRYHMLTNDIQGKGWSAAPDPADERQVEMMHLAVNVPEGSLRGSGDLDPILEWLARYREWLSDRALINRTKSRVVWDLAIEGADRRQLTQQRAEFQKALSGQVGIFAHNEQVKLKPEYPGIAADSAADDGRALRLMVAAGAGASLHHLGESDSANRASAASSDRAMLAHYRNRQGELVEFCAEVVERAAYRAQAAGRLLLPRGGLRLEPVIQELTKDDNLLLAQAAKEIVLALAQAKREGWVDDTTASALMFKFAGENAAAGIRN